MFSMYCWQYHKKLQTLEFQSLPHTSPVLLLFSFFSSTLLLFHLHFLFLFFSLHFIFLFLFFEIFNTYIFLITPCGMTRDQTHAPCSGSMKS